ncbi:hypothetical protein RD792_008370 [Penstemon davidsonii]|uniref:Uncharacterized protein n=1 Tax=Penstemon davidsonii TaxID=160366 RepID=A0ABR0D8X2_9LAMI|nr:hypothetical protein RD792_008370 [Penstemon davidsonii]
MDREREMAEARSKMAVRRRGGVRRRSEKRLIALAFRAGGNQNLKGEFAIFNLEEAGSLPFQFGTGKAFAFKLAEKGLNLVLVSRNKTKLEQVSTEILVKCPEIEIRLFELDFSEDVVSGIHRMKEEIKGLEIGILVNNVGVTYPGAMYFHEVDEKIWMNLVKVNVEGTSYVTKAVLNGMVQRKKGAIVNIGSGASVVVPSHPLYAIYAATKAYVDQLSRSLYVEYKDSGIDVQCQVPLYVCTKMASKVAFVEKSSVFIPSAEKYVEAAVRWIGHETRCTPYWPHSLQWFFASMLNDALLDAWRLSIGIKRKEYPTPTS